MGTNYQKAPHCSASLHSAWTFASAAHYRAFQAELTKDIASVLYLIVFIGAETDPRSSVQNSGARLLWEIVGAYFTDQISNDDCRPQSDGTGVRVQHEDDKTRSRMMYLSLAQPIDVDELGSSADRLTTIILKQARQSLL